MFWVGSIEETMFIRRGMERFDIRRGLIKEVEANGGLGALAKEFFDHVESSAANSFEASHGVMTSIEARYENGALFVDVTNVFPDVGDPEVWAALTPKEQREHPAMKASIEDRKRWTSFLDKATGHNSKKRGDKAKEWAKKASKAKSAISAAKHFMEMSESIPEDKKGQAESLIREIEELLQDNDNTKAKGRAEKLNKLFN